ncbi:MAG: lipase [Halothiobacillaceae bacterium]|nr:MAG: lipase [Halothiobacillaceae bacterium]
MEQESQPTNVATSVQEENIWKRGAIMVLFAFVTRLVQFVVIGLMILQFLFKLVTKRTNQRLLDLGQGLSTYLYSIVQFQTFNTEEQPYPFNAWSAAKIKAKKDEAASSSKDGVPPTQAQPS